MHRELVGFSERGSRCFGRQVHHVAVLRRIIEATDTGNILKYMCRWKSKNGLQDLEKAKWYLEHLIAHVAKLEEENKPIVNEKEENSL